MPAMAEQSATSRCICAAGCFTCTSATYGIHWLLNAVTGEQDKPQGVLIRACEGYPGPGRLTKALEINGEFTAKPVDGCPELWFAAREHEAAVRADRRVGIGFASEEDQARSWRFIAERSDGCGY